MIDKIRGDSGWGEEEGVEAVEKGNGEEKG